MLPQHGITAAEDTYYYRLLIALSLRPESSWWAKLDAERQRLDIFSPSASPRKASSQHGSHVPIIQQLRSSQHQASPAEPPQGPRVGRGNADHGDVPQTLVASASVRERHTADTARLPEKPRQQSGALPAAFSSQKEGRANQHPLWQSDSEESAGHETSYTIPARHVRGCVQQQGHLRHINKNLTSDIATEQWQEVADRFLEGSQPQHVDSLSHVKPATGKAPPRKLALNSRIEGVPAGSPHVVSSPRQPECEQARPIEENIVAQLGWVKKSPSQAQRCSFAILFS